MLIFGDISAPKPEHIAVIESAIANLNPGIDNGLVINLEGLLSNENHLNAKEPVLYSKPELIDTLNNQYLKAICLANNHTFDLIEKFDSTIKHINNSNIPYTGVSKVKSQLEVPLEITENNQSILIFNFCWDFLIYNQKNPTKDIFLSTPGFKKIIEIVKKTKKTKPDSKLLIYFHWSIDLEILPYPMYRVFSKKLIDIGAHLVVGCHSHCVQGGEKYKDGYIIYGLGNFFIPQYTFVGGKINYPDFTNRELVVNWNAKDNSVDCHWFDYSYDNKKHKLNYVTSNKFDDCSILKSYSPYQHMNQKEYISYFKKNRRKKTLMPLFKNYLGFGYRCSLFFIKLRAKFARVLAKNNIINWTN